MASATGAYSYRTSTVSFTADAADGLIVDPPRLAD